MKTHSNLENILYVDDDKTSLELFKTVFQNSYNVYIAPDVKFAYELLHNIPIKVLISDYFMPDETGVEFIARINPEFPEVVKILFTAFVEKEIMLEAMNKAGVYRYIPKPWNTAEIKNSIDSAIHEYNLKYENKTLLEELQIKNSELIDAFDIVKQSEEKFRSIFSNSGEGIYLINKEKQIIEANKSFIDMFASYHDSIQPQELTTIIEKTYPLLLMLPKDIALYKIPKSIEIDFYRDNQVNFYRLISSFVNMGNEGLIVTIIENITERKAFDKKLLDAILHTQEEEQKRYARDLHDGLGPILSTLKMHLEWMTRPDNEINRKDVIQHSIKTINEAVSNVKEIANNLSPHVLQRFGLSYAINTYLDKIAATSKIDINFINKFKDRLIETIEIDLYRILLECINNSLKHSKAKSIVIKLKKYERTLFVGFCDDGIGFEFEKTQEKSKGMGLFNIQNRIRHINCKYRLISGTGKGFKLALIINT